MNTYLVLTKNTQDATNSLQGFTPVYSDATYLVWIVQLDASVDGPSYSDQVASVYLSE